MLLRRAFIIHGAQRRIVAIAGAVDNRGPRLVISIVEPREQSGQRIRRAFADFFRQRQVKQFRAAAFIDFRAAGNLRDKLVAGALRIGQPCAHAAPVPPVLPAYSARPCHQSCRVLLQRG